MLTFEAATHTYRWHGRIVKSVTQILKAVYPGVYANIPAAILERKSKLGIATHRAIELCLLNLLDEASLHPEVVPYFESWRAWFVCARHQFDGQIWAEHQFYSPIGYPGTIDFKYPLGPAPKKCGIIDWKITDTIVPTHPIQTAAYAVAEDAEQAGCLYLQDDGSPAKYVETDLAKALPDWFATLRVSNIMERMR